MVEDGLLLVAFKGILWNVQNLSNSTEFLFEAQLILKTGVRNHKSV